MGFAPHPSWHGAWGSLFNLWPPLLGIHPVGHIASDLGKSPLICQELKRRNGDFCRRFFALSRNSLNSAYSVVTMFYTAFGLTTISVDNVVGKLGASARTPRGTALRRICSIFGHWFGSVESPVKVSPSRQNYRRAVKAKG